VHVNELLHFAASHFYRSRRIFNFLGMDGSITYASETDCYLCEMKHEKQSYVVFLVTDDASFTPIRCRHLM
jgi:hypothetical protein